MISLAITDVTTVSGALTADLDPNIGDPNAPRDGYAHAIVFGTGFMGATLPRFELATWVLGTCTDPNASSTATTDWPQFDESFPLENGPELFVDGINTCGGSSHGS